MSPSGYDVNGMNWNPAIREPGTNGLFLARGGVVAAGSGGRAIYRFDLATGQWHTRRARPAAAMRLHDLGYGDGRLEYASRRATEPESALESYLAEAARIVTVASRAHYQAKGIDWAAVQAPTRSIAGMAEYATSKLANVLFAVELARRLAQEGFEDEVLGALDIELDRVDARKLLIAHHARQRLGEVLAVEERQVEIVELERHLVGLPLGVVVGEADEAAREVEEMQLLDVLRDPPELVGKTREERIAQARVAVEHGRGLGSIPTGAHRCEECLWCKFVCRSSS